MLSTRTAHTGAHGVPDRRRSAANEATATSAGACCAKAAAGEIGADGQRHEDNRSAAAMDSDAEAGGEEEEEEEDKVEEARKMAGVMKSTRSASNIITAGTESRRPASTHCSQPVAGTTSCACGEGQVVGCVGW